MNSENIRRQEEANKGKLDKVRRVITSVEILGRWIIHLETSASEATSTDPSEPCEFLHWVIIHDQDSPLVYREVPTFPP